MGDALSQKTNARRVLAILVGLLASLLALQGIASMGPLGNNAFAQNPTPTNTTSGRAIKIINPDSTTSNEISNKSDGVDTWYHLVAWVNTPRAGDAVEFKYVPEGENVEINIQCTETTSSQARFVSPDTYECHWDVSNVAEGSETGTIRAVLYSNGNVVATDEEAATIDRTGQTVEITYPVNGGPMGFYTRPDGTSVGMIDFRTSGSTGEGDEGTQSVIAYYSISEPGTEPAFTRCSAASVPTTGGTQDSVRCTLPADDPGTASTNEARRPEQVTAVAVVPRDIDEGALPALNEPDPDAADGHRALGYSQDPRSVLLNPQTHSATPGACSQPISATVRDQNERKVVGVNVDVHAQGPTDNLHFDDTDSSNDNTNSHQPPENHPTESTVNCESPDTPRPFNSNSLQGEHDQIGPNDVKHIESTPVGTDNNGQFRFQLYTADAGTTQITAWADEDANDRFCAEEAHGNGSIGWNTVAPSPTGIAAEDTTCPGASPSPSPTATTTASPTGSPTASPTGTASPSPTGTASPSPTGTASPSPTGSPSPSPTDEERPLVESGPCEGFREGSRTSRQGGGEVIVGTQGPDELEGSSGNDLICALAGRDVVRGRGGNDQIHGDRGHDDLRGNQGNDSMFGSRGLDVIRGGAGSDEIRGGGQDDTIRGYTGRDRIFGGGGNDTIRAGADNDHLRGNNGDDVLVGGPGNDNCGGGRGDDRLIRC